LGQEVKVQGDPFLKGQKGRIQPFPEVDLLEVVFAEPAIMSLIEGFALSKKVP
jgi:hypothetical protein